MRETDRLCAYVSERARRRERVRAREREGMRRREREDAFDPRAPETVKNVTVSPACSIVDSARGSVCVCVGVRERERERERERKRAGTLPLET